METLKHIWIIVLALALASCDAGGKRDALQRELKEYVDSQDARIGVAVIIDGKDTVAINGHEAFPMLSVYKLPIALALGDYMRTGAVMVPDSVIVTRDDLKPDTYSPMLGKYASVDTAKVALAELLAYSLQLSDNNASDIILGLLPYRGYVNHWLEREGIAGICVVNSEDEMHADTALCRQNASTPLAMAALLDRLAAQPDDAYTRQIKSLLETCETGTDRLPKPLAGVTIWHKTGTGFPLPGGGIMAVNDAGYVLLPNGRAYAIAVFVADSPSSLAETEAIIARISAIVYTHLK